MPRTYVKRKRKWDESDMEQAIDFVKGGHSVNAASHRFAISEGGLRYRLQKLKAGEDLRTQGRKSAFTDEEEQRMASTIRTMCRLGFSLTSNELMSIVSDFVRKNNIQTPFKDGRPGPDWLKLFMKRNALSLKKAEMISTARKSATSNPFVIYDFYDLLEELMEEHQFEPDQIWNCDESGFPTDPQRCRVVSGKGESAYKITCGAGKENITTLAVCSAAGDVLDPLVIFTGKNFQSTWKGDKALPETYYGISENGWMTSDVFYDWFKLFAKRVTKRPLLLIFDGHLTHTSLSVIELAIEEGIVIVKLPPHATDKLQPLDVACFSALKKKWSSVLVAWNSEWGASKPITKSVFVNKISEVWHEGLSPDNVKAGFEATGICPLDRSKYPENRLDPRLLKQYNDWIATGKPSHGKYQYTATTSDCVRESENPNVQDGDLNIPCSSASLMPTHRSPSQHVMHPSDIVQQLGPIPFPAPDGKKWLPVWTLVDNPSNPTADRSFEETVLNRIKPPEMKEHAKRRKIPDPQAKVITHPNFVEAIRNLPDKGLRKSKQPELKDDTGSKSLGTGELSNDSGSDSDADENDNVFPKKSADCDEYFAKFWKSLSPPNDESTVVGKWYAVVYFTRKKSMLFIAKATRRFLKKDSVSGIEMDCLKPHVGSGTVLEEVPQHLPRDTGVFPLSDIIAGPISCEPMSQGRWSVPKYRDIQAFFEIAKHHRRYSK